MRRREPPDDEQEAAGATRRAWLVVHGAPLILYSALVWAFRWVCDDAYISFRYARNLAEGKGLRYNPGVEPPVEGYSNFGWVLWVSLAERLGIDPGAWAGASGWLAGALVLLGLQRFAARRLGLGAGATLFAGLLFATCPTVVIWSTSGLATMALAAAVFLTWERLLGDPDRTRWAQAIVPAAAAVLLRADGVYWLALIFALGLWQALRTRRPDLARGTLACAAAAALVLGAHVLFRVAYHGDWTPNTARAKVSPSLLLLLRGTHYLAHYVLTIPAALATLLAGVWFSARGAPWALRTATGLAAGTLAYGVLVGGDFMAMGRFYATAWPFLALVAAWWIGGVARSRGALRAGGVAALLLLGSVPAAFGRHVVPRSWLAAVNYRWGRDYETEREFWDGMLRRCERWSDVGRALALHARPDSSLVRVPIGAAGYFSGLTIHDRAGLVDREVPLRIEVRPEELGVPGHDRVAPPEFFADRRPTYMGASFVYDDANDAAETLREAREDPRVDVVRVTRADGVSRDGYLLLRRASDRRRRR